VISNAMEGVEDHWSKTVNRESSQDPRLQERRDDYQNQI
jgi:hypothetical protein